MGGEREEVINPAMPQRRRMRVHDQTSEQIQGEAASEVSGAAETVQGVPDADSGSTPAMRLMQIIAGQDGEAASGLGGQSVRMHESKGQIHFHADKEGLKAAVPIADVWAAWSRLEHLGTWSYLDTEFNTLLTIVTRLEAGDVVEAYINLVPCRCTMGAVFDKIGRVVNR